MARANPYFTRIWKLGVFLVEGFRPKRIMAGQAGFSLIELLAVAVILLILALIAVPIYAEVTDRAREAKTQENLRLISGMLEAYKAEHGHYPYKLADLIDKNLMKSSDTIRLPELRTPWSTDSHVIYYFYGVDTSNGSQPFAYVLGDPADKACSVGTPPCGIDPRSGAWPITKKGPLPAGLKFHRTSW